MLFVGCVVAVDCLLLCCMDAIVSYLLLRLLRVNVPSTIFVWFFFFFVCVVCYFVLFCGCGGCGSSGLRDDQAN